MGNKMNIEECHDTKKSSKRERANCPVISTQKKLKTCEETSIEQIPHFVLASILSKTGYEMMFILKLVCKKWNRATSSKLFNTVMLEDYCSKNIIITNFKIEQQANYSLIPKYFENHSWKDIFQLKRHDVSQGQGKTLGILITEYAFVKSVIYEGEIKNGKANGWGRKLFSNGHSYEGEFKDNMYHGKGKAIYLNGNIYEGEFKDNMYHGKGKMTFCDGHVYEGEWRNGERHGYGKYSYLGITYERYWNDDQMNGNSKISFLDGDVYEGEWKDGEMIIRIQKQNLITNLFANLVIYFKSLVFCEN